jgi:hypothetical protein
LKKVFNTGDKSFYSVLRKLIWRNIWNNTKK